MQNLTVRTSELQGSSSALRPAIEREILAYAGAAHALEELTKLGAQRELILERLILLSVAEQERQARKDRTRKYKSEDDVSKQLVRALRNIADQVNKDELLRPWLQEALSDKSNSRMRDLKKTMTTRKEQGERLDGYSILVGLPEILRAYAQLLEVFREQISNVRNSLSGIEPIKYRTELDEYVTSSCNGKGIRENLITLIDASNHVFVVNTRGGAEALKKYAQRHPSRPPNP